MPEYVITYDLRKKRDYEPLWAQLRAWRCARVLESVWLGALKGPAADIRSILKTKIDSDDGLTILELKPDFDWAAYKPQRAGADWMKAHSP